MTTTYTTPAQDAKAVREAIKAELGLTSRQVSVRAESFSMGSAVRVTVKVPADIEAIRRIACGIAERIDRCEATGEILNGGNRFVSVNWDHDLVESRTAELTPRIEALLDCDGDWLEMGRLGVRRESPVHHTVFWGGERLGDSAYDARAIAGLVVRHELALGAEAE